MSHHSGFLQAILDAPEDDTPRLVYADWLEDNRQPERAEFIRVQIELARLGDVPADCHFGMVRHARRQLPRDSAHRKALMKRQDALWKRHKAAWARELPELAGITWQFPHRGFADAVRADNFSALRRHAGRILAAAPIRGVDFAAMDGRSASRLARWPVLAHFTMLEFHGLNVRGSGLRDLVNSQHVRQLISLELSMNGIGDDGAFTLATAPNLGNLRALMLYMNGIWNSGAAALATSPHLSRLEILNLELNNLSDAGGLAFLPLGFPQMLHLNLYDNEFTKGATAVLRSRWGKYVELL